jgi:branched-chain amino acid aminotransferase
MFISFNGKITPADQPVFLAANRGYRYGDGLFETLKLDKGVILLEDLHFKRLVKGLQLLKFELPRLFSGGKLADEILHLAEKNQVRELGRVRLSVFRGNGGLYDADRGLQYLIECWPLTDSFNRMNENGLVIGIYPDARKQIDLFSGLKSASFLPYTMASVYARENKLNDCLLLNSDGHICDSTIANLFILKDGRFITPGPEQGAVDGVMRNYLVREMRAGGYTVEESPVHVYDVEMAEEVFLTNAIHGIRWVRQFRDSNYSNNRSLEIYSRIVKTIAG